MVGRGQRYRHPAVAAFADLGENRQPREQFHRFSVGHALATAGAKEIIALAAVGALEVAHVLDHAEQRTMDLAEHAHGTQGVGERNLLRRADDNDTVEGNQLRERELGVAGAGREVDHQEIERTPQGILKELAHGAAAEKAVLTHLAA